MKLMLMEAEAKGKLAVAKAELVANQANHSANWEVTQAQQASTSWKDEYALSVITIPMVTMFTMPVLILLGVSPERVQKVFDTYEIAWRQLDNAPVEYWYLIGAAFAATFGLRGLAKFWK